MKGLPENWAETCLSEIAHIEMGQSPDSSTYNEIGEGLPFFQGKAEFGKRNPVVRKWCKEPKKIAQKGDILLSIRAPVGPTNQADQKCCIGRGLAAVRVDGAFDQEYLYLFFKNIESWLSQQGTGSTFSAINGDFIRNLEVPIPPLAEQKRIADKLDALLARVDAARQRLDRMPQILKQFRQSVLAAATSGRLTEEWREEQALQGAAVSVGPVNHEGDECRSGFNPTIGLRSESVVGLKPDLQGLSSWCTLPFADVISELKNGLAQKPNEEGKGYRILRISSVRSGKVDFSDCRYLEVQDKELTTYSLRKGDLLFTRYNGSLDFVGVCGLIRQDLDADYVYPDKLMRVRLNPNLVIPEYVEIFMGSPNSRAVIEGFVKSSAGQKGISGGDLKTMLIDLPPLAEQKEIVRRVESLFAWADRLETRYHTARARLDQLTPALLAKAFRGQLVPQKPEDEPAAVLLERVRAGKNSAPQESRKTRRKLDAHFTVDSK